MFSRLLLDNKKRVLIGVGSFVFLLVIGFFVNLSIKYVEVEKSVDSAIELYKVFGAEHAFGILNDREKSVQGEKYVFAFRKSDGVILVQPARDGIVGKRVQDLSDNSGYNYGRYIYNSAQEGKKYVKYRTFNPSTKLEQKKKSIIKLHDGIFFGSGIYK